MILAIFFYTHVMLLASKAKQPSKKLSEFLFNMIGAHSKTIKLLVFTGFIISDCHKSIFISGNFLFIYLHIEGQYNAVDEIEIGHHQGSIKNGFIAEANIF